MSNRRRRGRKRERRGRDRNKRECRHCGDLVPRREGCPRWTCHVLEQRRAVAEQQARSRPGRGKRAGARRERRKARASGWRREKTKPGKVGHGPN